MGAGYPTFEKWSKRLESGDNSTVENEQTSRFVEFLGKLLDIEINFAVTEKRAEDYFDPKPARLAVDDKAAKSLDAALSSLANSLGSPPSVLILDHECEEPETYESYPVSVLSEMLSSFWKARRAICRVHLLFIAEQTVRTNPESMHLDESELIQKGYRLPPLKLLSRSRSAESS